MTDCNELMAKLNQIESKINSLDDKYLRKSERSSIVSEGASKGKSLAMAALLPLLGAFISKSDAIAQFNRAYNKALDAEDLANLANREVGGLRALAREAKSEATLAKGLARKASSKVDELAGLINRLARKIDDFIGAINRKVAKALSTALDALGIGKKARGLAGEALNLAGKALGKILFILSIIESIFSILNAIDLRNRMNALERRMSLFEKELSNLLSILQRIVNRVAGAEQLAQQARNIAGVAESIAVSARSTANQAKGIAQSAKAQAVAAVAQIAIVSAVAIGASGLAGRAMGTAQEALRRGSIPGPRGLPGIAGKNGLNGKNGQPGKRGFPGIMGRPGRNGINGQPGKRGFPGIMGRPGRNGINGQPGPRGLPGRNGIKGVDGKMNPMDTALLRRIDATTISTRNVQQVHMETSLQTNSLATRTKDAIGVDGLPVSVPDQIAKQNPIQKPIATLAELHLWQVEQLDGVMGRWPQQIPVGGVNVGMPNMAEAVSELVGMMVSQQVTATQILNTTSRTLVQSGSATQQAHLAHLVAKANAEFLGYENRPTQVDMPLAFSPGLDPFDGLLNESTQKIRGFENTDGQDFKSIVAELLQAAAIIRAVYWRKLDPKGDLRKQLKDQLRGQSDFIDQAAAGDGDDSDWQEYLKNVEEGFRGATGDANPYNRRPDEGPQIRDRSPDTDR